MHCIDRLVDILKIRFKDHADPEKSAYLYITCVAKDYIPEDSVIRSIEYHEKEVMMNTLKA